MRYHVYIVRCADDTLYTGITTDLVRRVSEHNGSQKGARYTRSRRPVTLFYSEMAASRSAAAAREAALRRLSRQEKLRLLDKA